MPKEPGRPMQFDAPRPAPPLHGGGKGMVLLVASGMAVRLRWRSATAVLLGADRGGLFWKHAAWTAALCQVDGRRRFVLWGLVLRP